MRGVGWGDVRKDDEGGEGSVDIESGKAAQKNEDRVIIVFSVPVI
jgi:hypothetical protein